MMFTPLLFSQYMPQGYCYLWKPTLVGLHLVSDTLIGLAYYSIPLTLLYFLKKRKNIPFYNIFVLFATCIILCGTIHLVQVWTLWHSSYWLSGLIKALTAGVSVYTAIALVPMVPQALDLRTPSELEAVNQQLETEVAERRQTEAELRELSTRLNLALEAEGIGIWDWDISHNKLIWDDRYCELFGITSEAFEHNYQAWASRVHPEDLPAAEALLKRALNNEAVYDTEFRVVHGDGVIRCLKANGLVQRDEQGIPIRMIGTSYDITKQKKVEQQLRESEQRYASLAAAAPVGIFRTDVDGQCIYVNDRWCAIAQLTPEEALGDGWLEGLYPADRAAIFAEWTQAIEENRPFALEYRFGHADSSVTWVYGQAVAELDHKNQVVGYVGCVTDITQRRVIEEQLRSQEHLTRSLFELANIGLTLTGVHGEWLRVNPKLSQMLEYEPEEFMELTWPELTYPEDLDKDLVQFNKLLRGEVEGYELEKRFVTKTGKVIDTDLTVGCSRKPDGSIDFVVASLQDISDRKAIMREIEESRQLYSQVLSSISDAVFVTDSQGAFKFICPNVETIFGYSATEIAHKESIEAVLDLNFYNLDGLIQSGGEVTNVEVSVRDRWDNRHDLLMNIKPVDVAGGDLLFTCRDISDRKQAELLVKVASQKAIEQARLFRNTFEQAAVGIAHVASSGYPIRLNQRFCDIVGYPADELMSITFDEITHPHDRNAGEAYLQQMLTGEISSYTLEKRYLHKDGSSIWVSLTTSLVRKADGSPDYAIVVIQDISDRKRDEAMLRLYEEVICTTPDQMSFVDRNYTYLMVNDAYAKKFHKPKTEIVGHTVTEFLGEDKFRETVKPYLDKTFAGEEVHYQNIFKFGDDQQYLDITYTPYRETHDSITGAVVSVRDISNIYQAELALSLQAQRAEALLLLPQLSEQLDEVEFMQQAQGIAEDLTKSQISFIHFINEDEETIDQVIWSQRTLEHYGQSPDDSHAPIREVRIWVEALRQRQPVVCNDYESDPHKQELPGGPAVLHRFLSVPVIEDGKVVMVTGVGNKASDYTGLDVETVQLLANQISRTIQHYRSLQTSRLLAAVVESTDDAILTKTLDSQITSWNSGAEKLLGYSAAEIVGKSTLILFPPGQEEEETQIVERLTHGQDIHHYETVRVHKNGTIVDVSLTVSPLKDRAEQLVGLSTIMRDITEHKQVEQQILAEIHQRQLLINQLERAKERLEESNQELQNFAYVASHDLQEPLRKIQAFGDRLNQTCQDSLSEKGQDYLARMLNAAARAQALINDLLSFSRVSTRAKAFTPTDLNEVMAGVLSDLEVRIEQTGATIEVEPLPTIDADNTQMRQVFQNLLSNALKFIRPEVPPQIQVQSECYSAEEREYWQLRVRDNGIGFDLKYCDRIFQPFQRLHGRQIYEGSGIGLAICRKIIRRHGGTLTAESQPGAGATFIATIPVHHLQQDWDEEA